MGLLSALKDRERRIVDPSSSTPETRLQVPEPTEPPHADTLLAFGGKISSWLGMKAAGWILLATVICAAVFGWAFTWIELKLAAVFGTSLLLIALLFTIGKPKYRVALSVDDRRVVVGDQAGGTVSVLNDGVRRSLPARLDLPVGQMVASFSITSLAAGTHQDERFAIPTDRRGVLTIGPAYSVQGDPFTFTGRETKWTESFEVFVHPRTVPLPGRQVGLIHDLEGHASPQLSPSDMSFHALREYVPGDDRRHIHWRSTARTGTLMVRQYELTLQSRVCVALDLGVAGYLGENDFEDAVSAVASIVLQAVREQNPIAVLTNVEALASVSAPRILDELSRVERQPRLGIFDLVNSIRYHEPGASVVILVTGAGTPITNMRKACSVFDANTRVVGLQIDPSASISVRNVSNVSLIRVDSLRGLPQAIRKAMS